MLISLTVLTFIAAILTTVYGIANISAIFETDESKYGKKAIILIGISVYLWFVLYYLISLSPNQLT